MRRVGFPLSLYFHSLHIVLSTVPLGSVSSIGTFLNVQRNLVVVLAGQSVWSSCKSIGMGARKATYTKSRYSQGQPGDLRRLPGEKRSQGTSTHYGCGQPRHVGTVLTPDCDFLS